MIVVFTLALVIVLVLEVSPPPIEVVEAQDQQKPAANAVWRVEKDTPEPTSGTRRLVTRRVETSPDAPLIAPIDRAWTTAGSTGTLDESSLAIAQADNFTTTFLPGTTGTITARYNITAVDGTTSFCPGTFAMVRMRYRNSGDTTTTTPAEYSWILHSSNITTGGDTTMVTYSSRLSASFNDGANFLTVTGTIGSVDFDFANNIYWLDVKIFRNNAAAFSDIGSFQFWESAGTPCP
jgi:hypothetical protein